MNFDKYHFKKKLLLFEHQLGIYDKTMNQKFIIYFEKEREEEGGLTQLNETKKADIETFFSIKSFNTLIGSGALYGKMLMATNFVLI